MREGKRAQGREEEEEVLAVGTRRTSGGEGGGGGSETGLLRFLTHTWQMSGHWVGLRQGETSVSAVVVSQIEKRFPFSFQCAFKRGFQPRLLSGPSRRLCKNSPTAVVIDAAALWRQLGQAGSLRHCLPPTLLSPTPPKGSKHQSLVGCVLFFF